MSRGKPVKYSHISCGECGKQNYEIIETRCNTMEFRNGERTEGGPDAGKLCEVKYYCKDCGNEEDINYF